MYDIERIGKIIADINKYYKDLGSYKISTANDLHESKTYNASSMVVFTILNRTIDLGSEIISAENLGAPDTYHDIMPILSKAGVMNNEQAGRLNKLIRKRNVLANFYEDMNEKELFKTIREVSKVLDFIEIVKKRIKVD